MFRRILAISLMATFVLSLVLNETALAASSATSASAPAAVTSSERFEKSKSVFQGSWLLSLGAKRFQDEFNQKSTTDLMIGANLSYQPLELIQFRVLPTFRSTNGYTQTVEENSGSSGKLLLREASASATLKMFGSSMLGQLSAGALNEQAENGDLLFADDISFPAAHLSLSSNPDSIFVGGVQGQTAVVTASSLSTQTQNFEKTPTFQSAQVFLKLQKTILEANLSGGVFQFENLPMSVATKAGLLGNTVTSITAQDSVFKYAYRGSMAKGDAKLYFSRSISSGVIARWVQNREAPTSLNQASSMEIYSELDLSRSFQLRPFYDFFRIESDALVSSFNPGALNSNRVGYLAGVQMSLQKLVRITLSGGERDVLLLSPTQSRERLWNIKLETFDVAI